MLPSGDSLSSAYDEAQTCNKHIAVCKYSSREILIMDTLKSIMVHFDYAFKFNVIN